MGKTLSFRNRPLLSLIFYVLSLCTAFLLYHPSLSHAAASLCAEVKIEVQQELTLERQAFDAHMRINNGLSHITLENVSVVVSFTDDEGNPVIASTDSNNPNAKFFIRKDSSGITDNGDGSWGIDPVQPSSSSDLHWLIIPAAGASNGVLQGTLYYVGATLSYTIGGEEHVTKVTPDYIYVKPMPELSLDYFLTKNVYGDDAWTAQIEPPGPFSLGLRVKNFGAGTAKALKIDSAQPKIVANNQGLLIGFVIEGTEVNDHDATQSLLVNFGDIAPNNCGVARWIMSCSLSGEFKDFTANISHSDELGGELTSLIKQQDTHTHSLIRDVLVDLSGRDSIRDFFALKEKEDGNYWLFESNGNDTAVSDQSSASQLSGPSGSDNHYTLTVPVTAGFLYSKLPDPHVGQMALKDVVRSDGKRIKSENAWLSKERKANPSDGWDYFVNLFDANTTDSYKLTFENTAPTPQAPVLQFIPNRSGVEGHPISFIVEASDPDATIPILSTSGLPAGATFNDQGTGTGTFNWTPSLGQAGQYQIQFSASDGVLQDSQGAILTICPAYDTDCDGMADNWETGHFGNLDRDGTGDFDGDGIPDLEEFILGSDPAREDHAPTVPVIQAPADNGEVDTLSPELEIKDSTDLDGDAITYDFEVFSDQNLTTLVASASNVTETPNTTSWFIPEPLADNAWYYWRVRATDGVGYSLWAYGSFFVNTVNDPPGAFNISRPIDNSTVSSITPAISFTNSTDPDGEALSYAIDVYADSGMTTLVTSVSDIPAGPHGVTFWVVDVALDDNTTYFWKVIATDPDGGQSETPLASFQVDTANHAPQPPVILSPVNNSEVGQQTVNLQVNNATDMDGDDLSYFFELDTVETFDTAGKRISGEIVEGAGTTGWSVSGLEDNTCYFWRVKAGDSTTDSPWTAGTFFVNTANDRPSVPAIKNPGINAWVSTLTPTLAVAPVIDPDNDDLTYRFQVYRDETLTDLVIEGESATPGYVIPSELDDNTRYYWRALAEDAHGELSDWTDAALFFVRIDGMNEPPQITLTEPSAAILTNASSSMIQWDDSDPDSNAGVYLYYDTDNLGQDGVLIAGALPEDPDGSGDTYSWNISGLGDGVYYVYGVITDEETTAASYALGSITIDRTAPTVTANPAGGDFSDSQSITLSVNETATIYYTLDGSDPTTGSLSYTTPVEITGTTTLKFMAVDSAGNQSAMVTEVYTLETPENFTVSVKTGDGSALTGINVYAFTLAGTYTGYHATTDETGAALFTMADFGPGDYRFRADYLGSQFWSDPAAIPNVASVDVSIAVETAEITVTTTTGIASGVNVYLFSESGAYLGAYAVTDENGVVSFVLPVGILFKFRADILGNQYFSSQVTIMGGGTNTVPVAAGGGFLGIHVLEDAQTSMTDIRVYLFSSTGSYLGLNQTTDYTGATGFDVPAGSYKIRADYLGYQFWSGIIPVTADTETDLVIPHQDITITVNSKFQGVQPLADIPVYLFTSGRSYMSQNLNTDANGQVVFHVPEKAYKVRADYLYQQVWSGDISWQDASIDIPMADAAVTVGWSNCTLPGVPVYAFTASGSYLNMTGNTNAEGGVLFRLPAAGSYKFRADYQTSQYWSNVESLIPEQVNPVAISTGGGSFVLTVLKDETTPLVGANCHVFSEQGTYFGVFGPSSSDGEVSFDLADGNYNIRVDYLGYQFWSNIYSVPNTLSGTFTIPHQAVDLRVKGIYQGLEESITGVPAYLYTSGGSYMNITRNTDSSGMVSFSIPDKEYKVRVDYLAKQYWSGALTGQNVAVDIPLADAEVSVTGNGSPLEGLPVYVFTASDSYLNISGTTNTQGNVIFRLPAGTYKFRTDYQNSQYWSAATALTSDQINPVNISTGGGTFTFTVLKDATQPLVGAACYLFDDGGTYLNLTKTASSEGQVSFDLANGSYKIRVDYMGYQFLSPVYDVPGTLSGVFTIPHQDITASVSRMFQATPEAMEGITVYLYTSAGSYLNQTKVTDQNGQAVFNLPAQPYKVRGDYLGQQFWSDVFNAQNAAVEIPMAEAEVTVTGAGQGLQGVPVYVYTGAGAYLNMNSLTDINGKVVFRLPAGTYKFRSDYQSSQYWSNVTVLAANQSNPVGISTGGGVFSLTVLKGESAPLVGVTGYLFNSNSAYLGKSGTTGSDGRISFNLADGGYKIRVDYLGYQFWTEIFQVPNTLSSELTISHQDITITVDGLYQTPEPMVGVKVYLFTSGGSYMSKTLTTDVSGQVVFTLPDKLYKVRADYLGQQFWSDPFQSQNTTITINEGLAEIHVHRSGTSVAGASVYLYSGTGSYLGWVKQTDVSGIAQFIIPDRTFKFRADQGGDQVYSPVTGILSGQVNSVEIDLE